MGLDNLDQNYYDPNFPGDNHPWGENSNYAEWLMKKHKHSQPLTTPECYQTIEVPEGSLVLTPNDTDIECRIKFNEWLEERNQ